MRVVVIGGTGVLGSKVIGTLRDRGHDAVAASRSTGVNALTGEGLRTLWQVPTWSSTWPMRLPSTTIR